MATRYYIILVILLIGAIASVQKNKLTAMAGLSGFAVGVAIFLGAGFTGIAELATFFLLGTIATAWGLQQKQSLGLAEKDKGKRTAGQVLANAGVAAILSLLVIVFPGYKSLLWVMIAASFASAAADTLSSEMGNLYGKSYYNILTLKRDKRGLNGVISLEGTLIGIMGSVCIAAVYSVGVAFSENLVWIVAAGTIGNLSDSFLGATLERKGYLNNNAVNFLNTAISALVIAVVYHFL